MKMCSIKRRKDCFFGIHSDFHAKPEEGLVIGETLKEEDVREICETLKPDFVQIDCKGHPGFTSYPTSFSNAMPAYKADPLALWRKVTKKYGIGLYCHFSGVYEEKYCREHPEDAVINAEGKHEFAVLPFSKYYDEFFIPQISELVEKYEIDGLWIDGDCWYVKPDYRPETLEKFQKEWGIDLKGKKPAKVGDEYFEEYLDYTREQYRKTLQYYVKALHEKHPQLQISSSWAFSDQMPGDVCAELDYLSGDLNPTNCVNSARYAGRMLAQQNMPWDLMAWGFRWRVYDTLLIPTKHPTQTMQEVATTIALGGAFMDNIGQFADASHNVTQLTLLAPVAQFMREREPYCFKGKMIHQAAMLVSTYDRYREMGEPFNRKGMEKLMGLTALLCDAGQSLELVSEHTLKGNYDKYPLIIVPEIYDGLEENTINDLKEYAKNGGSLLIVGSKTSRLFAERGFGFRAEYYSANPEIPNWAKCDIGYDSVDPSIVPFYFSLCGKEFGVTLGANKITPENANAKTYGMLHASFRAKGDPFAIRFPFGKGIIGVIGMDLGTQYNSGEQYLHRNLIKNMAQDMYTSLAKIESVVGTLELVCLKKDGRLMLQLVNANGGHKNLRCITEDYLPPIVDAKLSIKADKKPAKLVLQPEGKAIDFVYENGRVYFTVDRINVHNIVEVFD